MRVCLVTPYSWSFPGGVLEHVDALGKHLERRGHTVRLVAPNDPPDLRTRILHPRPGRHTDPPARVFPVGRSVPVPSNGSLANLAFSPGVFRAVRRAVDKLRPDVLHVHEPLLPPVSWAAVRCGRSRGIPVVGTFHAHYPGGCPYYRTFGSILEPFFEALDARIAVSEAAVATIAQRFPAEYYRIPNGVDTDLFEPSNADREPSRILFVGRSDGRKGLSVLLRAMPRVLGKVPQARLVIVGCRPGDVRLPKGLLSRVEVRGMVDDRELVAAMHTAEVLCAPSTGAESFGVVLIEAMAAGLPVVASDIPGYDSVVTPGEDGVLVPPGDPEALAGALVSVLRDRSLRARLSEAGLVTARRYDWKRIAAGVEEVYRAVESSRIRAAAAG